jgi:transposase
VNHGEDIRDHRPGGRGLLKNLGLVIGGAKMPVFCARTEELIQDRPEIATAVRPLLEARRTIDSRSLVWIAR